MNIHTQTQRRRIWGLFSPFLFSKRWEIIFHFPGPFLLRLILIILCYSVSLFHLQKQQRWFSHSFCILSPEGFGYLILSSLKDDWLNYSSNMHWEGDKNEMRHENWKCCEYSSAGKETESFRVSTKRRRRWHAVILWAMTSTQIPCINVE